MPYDPKDPVWCKLCQENIPKARVSRHRKQATHLAKANGTWVDTSKPFLCEVCKKSYPHRYKTRSHAKRAFPEKWKEEKKREELARRCKKEVEKVDRYLEGTKRERELVDDWFEDFSPKKEERMERSIRSAKERGRKKTERRRENYDRLEENARIEERRFDREHRSEYSDEGSDDGRSLDNESLLSMEYSSVSDRGNLSDEVLEKF